MDGILADIIIIAILLVILGASVFYIWKSKKKGIKCIGCPYSGSCSGGCHSNSADSSHKKK